MNKILFLLATLSLGVSGLAREVSDFCSGWEFSRDEKSWRAVEVPHDWAIEGPFDPNGDTGTGKLPWKGVGYYRKALVLDEAPQGKRIFLDFDGIMCDGTVFVNGQPVARQPYGYLGLTADLTPYLFKGTNAIVVKADTTKLFSRWYPGAGMYRRVRKVETSDIYLDARDIAVTTERQADGKWMLAVRGEVTSRQNTRKAVSVKVRLDPPQGKTVCFRQTEVELAPFAKSAFALSLPVEDPELWEMKPGAALYDVALKLVDPAEGEIDDLTVTTGFREFVFDADKGFILNGKRVQLNGACLHSDLGILGMAFNRSAMRRELLALMDMGVNAIRTSHNAPSPELLELCDELGLFVWDECFDKWNGTCARGDEPLEEYVPARLREFVRRDRNHPCVFVWSIGNEISPGTACPPGQEHWAGSPALGTSAERCARFRAAIRELDVTRPVGIASCFPEAVPKGDYAPLDITGWNYNEKYLEAKRAYPEKPVLYTESASALSDYGDYAEKLPGEKTEFDFARISVDSYDRNAGEWSDIADHEFERMERDPFVGGEFVWTGVDYLGEPTPYGWNPIGGRNVEHRELARSSYFGVYDLLVRPKDRVFLYRAHWRKDALTLHLVPAHWNFADRKGGKVPVYVYTSADEAELFLNGTSLGRRKKDPTASCKTGYYDVLPRYRLIWNDVTWKPGELKVVAYGKNGEVLGEKAVRTADAAASVTLAPEATVLPADSRDYVFVEVSLADGKGVRVPCDSRRVAFAVEGPGEIVSVGNSNPRGLVSFKDVSGHPLYNSRAGLFLRRKAPGKVTLKASAEGLAPAAATFD